MIFCDMKGERREPSWCPRAQKVQQGKELRFESHFDSESQWRGNAFLPPTAFTPLYATKAAAYDCAIATIESLKIRYELPRLLVSSWWALYCTIPTVLYCSFSTVRPRARPAH